jgi:hypothetical protein
MGTNWLFSKFGLRNRRNAFNPPSAGDGGFAVPLAVGRHRLGAADSGHLWLHDPFMKALRPRMVLVLLCYFIAGVRAYPATTNDLSSITVQTNVDGLLNARGKVNWLPMVERIVAFGDRAVPILTNRLANTNVPRNMRFCIVMCLCRINTDASLKPVRDILRNSSRDQELLAANQAPRESATSLWCEDLTRAIREYPTNREAEVLPSLIRLSDPAFGGMVGYYATERLREMIRRQPSVAGVIVASLDDRPERELFSGNLGEILALESGHHTRWGVFGHSDPKNMVAKRNSIWRDWWKRNKDKSIAEWLAEAEVVPAVRY